MVEWTDGMNIGETIQKDDPWLSICLCAYNGEKYIKEQIASVLPQLREHDEVIVSDDLSGDGTLEIVKSFNDGRVKIFSGTRFGSPVKNFEFAISKASRDIIVLCDQDDVWLEGRAQLIRDAFIPSGKPTISLAVLNSRIVDSDLKTIHDSLFDYLAVGPGIIKNIYRNTYIGCHMAFPRKLAPYILPFPENIPMHDYWIGLVCEAFGNVRLIHTPTMLFRRHSSNFTKPKNSVLDKLKWRLWLIVYVMRYFPVFYYERFIQRVSIH